MYVYIFDQHRHGNTGIYSLALDCVKFDIVVDANYYLVHTYFLLLFICTHSAIYFVQFTSFYFLY